MDIIKCTFDELPDAMQMHVLYCEKITVAEYRLAIWSNKDTLYYNNLPEKEVERFVSLIESDKKILNNRTMNSIYNKYGFVVYHGTRQCVRDAGCIHPSGFHENSGEDGSGSG